VGGARRGSIHTVLAVYDSLASAAR
jgi:hypothetical protein